MVGRWTDTIGTSFVGSSDDFEITLDIGHDFTFEHQYEGVFFVETHKGTRYWHKAAGGQNSFLDRNGIERVEQALLSKGLHGYSYWFGADVGRLPKTADFYTYLNPQSCR